MLRQDQVILALLVHSLNRLTHTPRHVHETPGFSLVTLFSQMALLWLALEVDKLICRVLVPHFQSGPRHQKMLECIHQHPAK